jgi:hypothetical protein
VTVGSWVLDLRDGGSVLATPDRLEVQGVDLIAEPDRLAARLAALKRRM